MPKDSLIREPAKPSAVMVVAHPPERRRGRSSVPAQAGHCCCCCCCCCLHSLGGLIGAIVAPNLGNGSKRLSYLSLTHYWDEEYSPRPGLTSTREREAITAETPFPPWKREEEAITAEGPVPPVTPAEPLRSYARQRGIALPASGASAVSLFWRTVLVVVIAGWCLLPVAVGAGMDLLIGGLLILLGFPAMQFAAAVVTALILAASNRPDKSYQFMQLGKIVVGMVAGTLLGILVMVGLYVLLTRR